MYCSNSVLRCWADPVDASESSYSLLVKLEAAVTRAGLPCQSAETAWTHAIGATEALRGTFRGEAWAGVAMVRGEMSHRQIRSIYGGQSSSGTL